MYVKKTANTKQKPNQQTTKIPNKNVWRKIQSTSYIYIQTLYPIKSYAMDTKLIKYHSSLANTQNLDFKYKVQLKPTLQIYVYASLSDIYMLLLVQCFQCFRTKAKHHNTVHFDYVSLNKLFNFFNIKFLVFTIEPIQ